MIGEYIHTDDVKRCGKCDVFQAAQIATVRRELFLSQKKAFHLKQCCRLNKI